MLIMFFMVSVVLVLSVIILFISFLISSKISQDREKLSSYECGFMPFSMRRYPFSLHFFLIGVIFLVFDVEIVLLLPMVVVVWESSFGYYMIILLCFIGILLFGLFYEWKQGALSWSI